MLKAKRRNPFKHVLKFVTYFDGKVRKVELGEYGRARFSEFHYHEEGWSSSYACFTRHENSVQYKSGSDGTDCDGRMSTHAEAWCYASNLTAHKPWTRFGEKKSRVRFPKWDYTERGQRDYAAEAMGY